MRWIQDLPPAPLDIVGDVHGELQALETLLGQLGWRDGSAQAQGRHLVFVGDLIDRGPDSVAVVDCVQALVQAGHASAILGNHELNALRGEHKSGNHWFFGEQEQVSKGVFYPSRLATAAERGRMRAFFATLPLALSRSDLRVVHACWHAPSIELLEQSEQQDLSAIVDTWDRRIDRQIRASGLEARARRQAGPYDLRDPSYTPPLLASVAEAELLRQTKNPVRVLTSGLEQPSTRPFWAAGRWRMLRRVPWWREYRGPMVVVGHYWRRPPSLPSPPQSRDGKLFDGEDSLSPMGAGDVFCVDYSVGRRYLERLQGVQPHQGQLGAIRTPGQGQARPWRLCLGGQSYPLPTRTPR